MKKLSILLFSIFAATYTYGYTSDDLVWDFEWLEPDNKIEIVVGEPYQLKYTCSTNYSKVFSSEYASNWVHYDYNNGQSALLTPEAYTISESGVITGLTPGSYGMKCTGLIQAKSGAERRLNITIVSERSEKESNNTLDTANDIMSKIRFGLYNASDVDYFRYTNNNLKFGDWVIFKIHYYGSRENPFGYKWTTFSGTTMSGSGSLVTQDQECQALVINPGSPVYLEIYYDQSRSQYFNYFEEFVAEVYINGVPASGVEEIVNDNRNHATHYDLNGKIINPSTKGLHIIKYKSGRSVKVIVK